MSHMSSDSHETVNPSQQYMHAAFKKFVVGDFSDAQSKA